MSTVFLRNRKIHTFGKLLDEMLGNGLELGGVNIKHLLQTLDFLQEILWHIGHRTWNAMLVRIWNYIEAKWQLRVGRYAASGDSQGHTGHYHVKPMRFLVAFSLLVRMT